MIKIIKQGKPNRKVKRIYKHECPMCGCIFEFDVGDTMGTCFGETSIACPCCGRGLGLMLENTQSRLVEIEVENE